MNKGNLETFGLCSVFVFLFGALGFTIASIMNAVRVYIESSAVEMYYNWVRTQMFSITYLPYYLLAGVLFAGVGLFIIYLLSSTDFT